MAAEKIPAPNNSQNKAKRPNSRTFFLNPHKRKLAKTSAFRKHVNP